MTSASDEKWRTFNCFFQSREQVVVRRGQIGRIGWVIKTLEAQEGQFLLDWKCPLSWDIIVLEQDPLVKFPRRFSFKMSFNCTSRDELYSALIVWPFGRYSMRRMPSWSPKNEARTFPADSCTWNFLGRGEPLCLHSIECCFVSES